ncbi:MAG: glycosyltransferase [Hyphomicrobiales bacterium]|nr:glycosyltransferase [Hyphomicrobiales bacterium]
MSPSRSHPSSRKQFPGACLGEAPDDNQPSHLSRPCLAVGEFGPCKCHRYFTQLRLPEPGPRQLAARYGYRDGTLARTTIVVEGLAALALIVWLYLLFARGGFWLCTERDRGEPIDPPAWPAVTAIIPARNEADGIGDTIASLLAQRYAGDLRIILVDDDSSDGTAERARQRAAGLRAVQRLEVIRGQPLPRGWTGKLWALKQGIEAAQAAATPPDYLLLSDADIVYAPDVLAGLVARARAGKLVLTSLMVKLRCASLAERSLIPAFIFFFQMLYPFPWVNQPRARTAAAAGGCMLVRSDALNAIGGIDAIRNALIDDCALARRLKTHGPIWLGLTDRAVSSRAYPRFDDIRRMVARSAYAQLRYSPLLLAGTVLGMALTYLAPPLLAAFAEGPARWLGLLAWALMAVAVTPTLRFYGRSPLWGPVLPLIALCYMLFTLDSALQHARGRGGLWKGRVQAQQP